MCLGFRCHAPGLRALNPKPSSLCSLQDQLWSSGLRTFGGIPTRDPCSLWGLGFRV